MSKLAADMTVEEFAAELKSMWERTVNITGIERDKNNRSYLGKQSHRNVSGIFASKQTKIAMQRGDNGFTRGKLL